MSVSAVCRCAVGPGGLTSDGAAHAASGGATRESSGGAPREPSGDALHAGSGRSVVAGAVLAGKGAAGSGTATGTSPPTRTCDHGTDGPRNGGAASGGRGAAYGSLVHVGCTSSGRWAE